MCGHHTRSRFALGAFIHKVRRKVASAHIDSDAKSLSFPFGSQVGSCASSRNHGHEQFVPASDSLTLDFLMASSIKGKSVSSFGSHRISVTKEFLVEPRAEIVGPASRYPAFLWQSNEDSCKYTRLVQPEQRNFE